MSFIDKDIINMYNKREKPNKSEGFPYILSFVAYKVKMAALKGEYEAFVVPVLSKYNEVCKTLENLGYTITGDKYISWENVPDNPNINKVKMSAYKAHKTASYINKKTLNALKAYVCHYLMYIDPRATKISLINFYIPGPCIHEIEKNGEFMVKRNESGTYYIVIKENLKFSNDDSLKTIVDDLENAIKDGFNCHYAEVPSELETLLKFWGFDVIRNSSQAKIVWSEGSDALEILKNMLKNK